ncbi:hypothetical protein L873DRAFT_762843 [Choiromyces venosus 120613-1]|uniref:Uncharacterized protein n=1 Tax=Choiromyces venosus 120613-1 TaxID=1336337 RepID=A0A3N4JU26_9PEZI|nr:hypothetical protein L873DRAFT_762843 [Choiromyces venosus 120613-1]
MHIKYPPKAICVASAFLPFFFFFFFYDLRAWLGLGLRCDLRISFLKKNKNNNNCTAGYLETSQKDNI